MANSVGFRFGGVVAALLLLVGSTIASEFGGLNTLVERAAKEEAGPFR